MRVRLWLLRKRELRFEKVARCRYPAPCDCGLSFAADCCSALVEVVVPLSVDVVSVTVSALGSSAAGKAAGALTVPIDGASAAAAFVSLQALTYTDPA